MEPKGLLSSIDLPTPVVIQVPGRIMNGETLGRVLAEDPFTSNADYLAVLTLDELPKEPLNRQGTIAFIVNTDPSNEIGEHWVAVYGDKYSPRMEYFDSYGIPPFRDAFERFFNYQKRGWIRNQRALQGELSSTCGYYCLYYLLLRCRGHRMKDITLPFSEDRNTNDDLVQNFIHKRFDIPKVDKVILL